MLCLQAYRFQLRPNGEQERKRRQFAGSARYVFNRALAIQEDEREKTGRKRSGYATLSLAGATILKPHGFGTPPSAPPSKHCENPEIAWSRHVESLKKLRLGQIQPGEVVVEPLGALTP